MKALHMGAFILTVVGALNWGLVGAFNLNLVSELGLPSGLEQVVYVLVGLSAVWLIVEHKKNCKACSGGM